MELDEAKARRLGQRILSISGLFDDRFDGATSLASLLLRRDTIFLELGNEDGLVFAEQVEKGGVPLIHIIIFNRRRLLNLDDMLKGVLRWAFSLFKFRFISAWIPEHNRPARHLAERLGFNLDGVARGIFQFNKDREGGFIYSISPEELQ